MLDYEIKKLYEDMELYLIQSMKRNFKRHLLEEEAVGFAYPQWQSMKLKELKRYQRENKEIVGYSTKGFDEKVVRHLRDEFEEGSYNVMKDYKEAMGDKYKANKRLNNSFFKTNDKKVNSLIKSVNNDLTNANKAILRMTNDQYRQVIFKSEFYRANGVLTTKQAIDMANREFLKRGLNVIEYKDGKRVNIASYSEMAIRTAGQRAMLMGEGEARQKLGTHLIRISTHGTSCKLCHGWQGKILIDDVYGGGSKKDGNYTLLSEAMKQGLFHPNCKHGVTTYFDGADDISDINESYENGKDGKESNAQYQDDLNYINRKIKEYTRLEVGSLDEGNIKQYGDKRKEWENKKEELVTNNKPLTQEEKDAIEYYVSGEGMFHNDALRGRNGLSIANLNDKDKEIIKNLDNALDKPLESNIKLYRNVDASAVFGDISLAEYEDLKDKLVYGRDDKFANAVADKYIPKAKGKEILDKGYLSTTKDYDIAKDWGDFTGSDKPIVLELETTKNTKGLDLKDFEIEDDPQKEVLLARNTKYKIQEVTAKDGNIYVKATILDDKATNFKIEYLEDEFEGLDEKLLNEQKKQLTDLTNKFPKMQRYFNDNPLYVGAGHDKDALAWTRKVRGYEVQKISFNKDSYKDYVSSIEKERKSVKTNWAMPCSEDKLSVFTVTHEYGHVIHNTLINEYIKANPEEYAKIRQNALSKKNLSQSKKILQNFENKQVKGYVNEILEIAKIEDPDVNLFKNLSEYGRTSYFEAFAEIFANSQCGEPNILGRAMIKFLEERLK